MNDVRKGDDLRGRAFGFACDIVRLNDDLFRRGSSARQLGRQLLNSGTSVGANLEEADAAQSRADFKSKCSISLKEARESHYWLRILSATQKLEGEEQRLVSECNELVAILTTIVRKVSTNG